VVLADAVGTMASHYPPLKGWRSSFSSSELEKFCSQNVGPLGLCCPRILFAERRPSGSVPSPKFEHSLVDVLVDRRSDKGCYQAPLRSTWTCVSETVETCRKAIVEKVLLQGGKKKKTAG